MNQTDKPLFLSIVVPIYNEVENVPILYQKICEALEKVNRPAEMILVDDGSKDGTRDVLRRLAEKDPRLRVILFRKNFGQSAAMSAGFRVSKGEFVIAMDGDLQNDPTDIPKLIRKAEEGYDVVSGWRRYRQDKWLKRKLPSKIANKLICSVTDVRLHDTGCSLKLFRRDVVNGIRLYGELHRFLPALARVEGASIAEVEVNHHARKFGKSKYNITRTFRVIMDLSSLNLFLKYLRNPMHFFGAIGVILSGFALLGTVIFLFTHPESGSAESNVLATLLFLIWILGFQFLSFGFVASLIVRTGNRRGQSLAVHQYKN